MGTPQQEQYPSVYCRKCESVLGKPQVVEKKKIVEYGIVANEHGAVLRRCPNCIQLWLGYMQEFPKGSMKIILKMVDKEL